MLVQGSLNFPLTPEWATHLWSLTASAWPASYSQECFYVRLKGLTERVLVASGSVLVQTGREYGNYLKVTDLKPGDLLKLALPAADYDLRFIKNFEAYVHLSEWSGSRHELLKVVEIVPVTAADGTLINPASAFVQDPQSGVGLSVLDSVDYNPPSDPPVSSVFAQLNGCLCALLDTSGDCHSTKYFPMVTLS